MRALLNSSRKARSVSMPLSPCMRRSRMTMSGGCFRKALIASWPFSTSATTSMSAASLTAVVRPMRITIWSSTSRMRIFLLGAESFSMASNRFARGQRHFHPQRGSRIGLALDRKFAAELRRATANAPQAEVAALVQRIVRAETDPVVGDREGDGIRAVIELEADSPGHRVTDGVGGRFL